MSKILRHVRVAPTILVGERHLDHDRQKAAVAALGRLFPTVTVTTDPDGARFIPIEEVFAMEQALERVRQEAYQAGMKDGQAAGLKQGLTRAEQVLRQFDAAIKEAISQRSAMLEEARKNILNLVLQISRQVTFGAVEVDPESTVKLISGVIDTLLDRSRIKIKVDPDHLPIVEQNVQQFLKGSATIKEIAIEPDSRVRYGGCFIETPHGDIDARLESQFEIIEEALLTDEAGR